MDRRAARSSRGVYRDAGKLLEDCRAGKVGCVEAEDMDTVCGQAAEFFGLCEMLGRCGVEVRLRSEGVSLKPGCL